MANTLYLVATPIGNLEDITLRALRVLKEVQVIAAEDTRQTRKLLSHYSMTTHLVSYHEHSGPEAVRALIERMVERGEDVALVTDAGTPGISDPGFDLVCASINAGVTICPIPGATAPICALIGSGLPTARFLFEGFLPRTKSTRMEKLKALVGQSRTVVFFESPVRLGETLGEISRVFGPDRRACVARELTKMFEQYHRGSLGELAKQFGDNRPRGECVVVVEGAGDNAALSPEEIVAEDANEKELLKRLASCAQVDKKALYGALVKLKNERGQANKEQL